MTSYPVSVINADMSTRSVYKVRVISRRILYTATMNNILYSERLNPASSHHLISRLRWAWIALAPSHAPLERQMPSEEEYREFSSAYFLRGHFRRSALNDTAVRSICSICLASSISRMSNLVSEGAGLLQLRHCR